MIINADTIRLYRPIAKNIPNEHINVYINEAEKLDILPAIGAGLYRKFSSLGMVAVRPEAQAPADKLTVPAAVNEELQPTAAATVFTGSEGDLLLRRHQGSARLPGLRPFHPEPPDQRDALRGSGEGG